MARVRIPKVGEVWCNGDQLVEVVGFDDPHVTYRFEGKLYSKCVALFHASFDEPADESQMLQAA